MLSFNSILQNGKYRILNPLGQGGFGITYLAEDTKLVRNIAIKELFIKNLCWRENNNELRYAPENRELFTRLYKRFFKEAKNLASINHPNIIHIHDCFEENGTVYYVMDFLEGENLQEIVKKQGPLSSKEALEIITQVAKAVEYIHNKKMTHFDIKPSNLMVMKESKKVILIDFGLSMQFETGDANTTMLPAISDGFSAIEMYRASSFNTFSPQTDIYSLGASLYYLITGVVPPSTLEIATGEKIVDFSKVPEEMKKVLSRSMSLSKFHRIQTVNEFLRLLPISCPSSVSSTTQRSIDSRIEDNTILLTNSNKIETNRNNTIIANQGEMPKTSMNSFFKKLIVFLVAIGIIVFILYACGFIVFWDNVAPISLGVWE